MLKAFLGSTALAILIAGGAVAQTTDTSPGGVTGADADAGSDNDANAGTPAAEAGAPGPSIEGWSDSSVSTFFNPGDYTTLRSSTDIQTSFSALTADEQDQIRAQCATLSAADGPGTSALGGNEGSAADGTGTAMGTSTGTTETGLDANVAPAAEGGTASGVSNATWTQLCNTVGSF